MKDTYYFSHDYNARLDEKIKKLLSKHGFLGYGLFWALIEDLYNNTNVLRLDYDTISFDLRCEPIVIKSIINDFDLFVFEGENFGSLSVQKRLDERKEISNKARASVLKRWANKGVDTVVLQSNNDSNTSKGKERKVKEKKIKEIKGKERKVNVPTEKEFLDHCEIILQNKFNEYEFALVSKYNTWKDDGWVDGNKNKIINWKNKINNTIPYLKPIYKNGNNNNNNTRPSKVDAVIEGGRKIQELIDKGLI